MDISSKRTRKDPPPAATPPVMPPAVKKVKKTRCSKPRSRLTSSTGSIQSLLNAASLLEVGEEEKQDPYNSNYRYVTPLLPAP